VYKKNGVNILQPFGEDWKQVYGATLSKINAGLTGIFGVTKDGYLVSHNGKNI